MPVLVLLWQIVSTALFLPRTTADIIDLQPVSISGEYSKCPNQADRQTAYQNINTNISNILMNFTNNNYISIQSECGEGMWHQVINLDMTDPSQECPSTWIELQNDGVRVCAAEDTAYFTAAVCKSVFYNTIHPYTHVCGRAIGYQIGGAAAFGWTTVDDIDSSYLYGLSITHGIPRTHIWTFTGGITEGAHYTASRWECPCNSPGSTITAPLFVGSNYFCESGNPTTYYSQHHWYSSDQLWDGQQCVSEGTCCDGRSSFPWFRVELPAPTSDRIEARICKPRNTPGENVVVQKLEIYVH